MRGAAVLPGSVNWRIRRRPRKSWWPAASDFVIRVTQAGKRAHGTRLRSTLWCRYCSVFLHLFLPSLHLFFARSARHTGGIAIVSWPIQCLFLDGRCHRAFGYGGPCRKRPHGVHGRNAVARGDGNGRARRVLQLIDRQLVAWQSGDLAAMRRLRMIHWGSMLANIVIIATLASSARFIP